MLESGLRFAASDGKMIAYQKVSPSIPAKAVVVIGHGMNDYGSRFLELAETIASIGVAAYIPDLRGHGDTDEGENRGYLGDADGFERVVEDLMELGDFAAKEQGGIALYYFGHSFGALLGLALCGIYGKYLDGVVLSAPPEKPAPLLDFAGGLVVTIGMKLKGARAPAKLPRAMTFGGYAKTVPNAKTGSDWISRTKRSSPPMSKTQNATSYAPTAFTMTWCEDSGKSTRKAFLKAFRRAFLSICSAGARIPSSA